MQEPDALWTEVSGQTRPNGEVFPARGSTAISHLSALTKAIPARQTFKGEGVCSVQTPLPEEAGSEAEALPD